MYAGKLSLLVVSHCYPPNAEVGSRRVAGFCKYFPEFGIDPVVLTIDEASCEMLDSSVNAEQIPVLRVKPRRTLLDRYRKYRKHSAAVSGSKPEPTVSVASNGLPMKNLRRHLLASLQYPDAYRGWYAPALKAAQKVIAERQIDAVLSSGPPWTCHAVASRISRLHNLPWVADFRDEWTSNPWRKRMSDSQGIPMWREKLDSWTEHRWLRRAALIVCTTDQQRASMLGAHASMEADKSITIMNGFDIEPGRFEELPKPNHGQRVLLSAGQLYGGRRIDTFCAALLAMVQNGQLSSPDLKVIFMGEVDPEIEQSARARANELFESGIITIETRIPWDQTQDKLRQVDALLIIQGEHPTAIPAKFFECLITGKPLLVIAGPGALRDIVLETRSGCVADPNDQGAIGSAIQTVLGLRTRSVDEVMRVANQFHIRQLTEQLARRIRTAAAETNVH